MAIISINGKAGSGKDTVGKIICYLTDEQDLKLKYGTKYDFDHTIYQFIEGKVPKRFTYEGVWQIKKYSDKLKDMVCILIGCTREQLEDQTFKATPLGEEWESYQISWDCKPTEWERSFKTEDEAIKYLNDHGAETDVECAYRDKLIRKIELTSRDILQKLGTDFGRDMLHPDVWINALFAEYKNTQYIDRSEAKRKYIDDCKWIITDSRFQNDVERVKSLGGICIRVNRDSCNGRLNEHESETALDKYEGFDYVIDNNGTIEELIEKVKEILIKENIIK